MASLKTRALTALGSAVLLCLMLAALPCGAGATDRAQPPEYGFPEFAMAWIDRIQEAYIHTRQDPKMEETATGVVASYHHLDTSSVKWEVTPAPGQDLVFTAVLYYREHLVQSRASTRERAMEGPFYIVSTKEMMEIFLYENGSWMR